MTTKPNNTLNLTIKFASLQALVSLTDKLPIGIENIGNQNNSPTYLPYILSQGIIDCIRRIKPDLQQRKLIKYTKTLSLGIGLITSAYVSCNYNGVDYILNFSLTLLKTTATTLLIDKLNKLNTIDGVSIAILMNFIFTIPNIIMGLSSQPLTSILLFIASVGVMAYGNYKLFKHTEDIKVHHKSNDKLSLSTRNTYTTSLVISNFITGLITSDPLIQGSLLFIINPLLHWFMSSNIFDTKEFNKQIQNNGIFINGLKHGKETEDCIKQIIKYNSIKLGFAGALIFIVSSLLIKTFAISISPIMLSVLVNSFISVNFSVKTIMKSNKYNQLMGMDKLKC